VNPRRCFTFVLIGVGSLLSSTYGSTHNWQSYLQIRYTLSDAQNDYASLRRLKLYGQGPILGDWNYYVQFLYKANNQSPTDYRVVIQEANATIRFKSLKLTVGQFKPPFGLERFTSDALLALIDRSQPTDRLIPNGSLGWSFARARGVQIEKRIRPSAQLALGIFEGNGANQPFCGNGPLIAGRITYEPVLNHSRRLRSELAFSWRKDHDINFLGQLPGAPPDYANFVGSDLRENIAFAYDFGNNSISSDYFADRYSSDDPSLPSIDAKGYYFQWAYYALSRKWSAAMRYEVMDPDRSITNSKDICWFTIGATYYLNCDYQKIQANYVFKSEKINKTDDDVLLIQYQQFLM